MTPFEYSVLMLFALFSVTNLFKIANSEKLGALPRWQVNAIVLLTLATAGVAAYGVLQ